MNRDVTARGHLSGNRMPPLRRLLPALLLLLSACAATFEGPAQDLARKGAYVEAAEAYDGLVKRRPWDTSLAPKREELRQRALEQLLGRAKRSRLEERDEEAEGYLAQFLAFHDAWETRLSGGVESSLQDEVESTRAHLRATVSGPAQRGLALVAETQLLRKRALLSHRELGRLNEELTQSVRQGAQATCARLKGERGEGTGVHWQDLVARYCRHFGQQAPEAPLAPELLGTPTWEGALTGASAEETQALQSALARVFEASPWFAAAAPRSPVLALAGSSSVQAGREPVRLTAQYEESEPYKAYEDHEEHYKVPYQKTETYTENGQTKTREVTDYRTETKHTVEEVTRYRDVTHEFHYGAVRVWAEYHFAGSVRGALVEGRAPLTVLVEDTRSDVGFDHDTHFPAAHLEPSRAQLASPQAWFAQQRSALQEALRAQLAKAWQEAWCSATGFSLDEAARCARSGLELPGPAQEVLGAALGGDAAHVRRLYLTVP